MLFVPKNDEYLVKVDTFLKLRMFCIRYLIMRLRQRIFIKLFFFFFSSEPSYYPIILTGDFNLKPYTLVYNLLVNGTVDNISQCYQPPNLQFRSPNKPLIPVRLGITDGCQHYHVMKNRDSNRTEISDFQYVKVGILNSVIS